MHAADAGDCARVWLVEGFRFLISVRHQVPVVFELAGVPVLMLPRLWSRRRDMREAAFAAGIAFLFLKRYGFAMLVRGVMLWPQLVEMMGEADGQSAAD
jgi:hypothetical protein